MIVFAHLGHWYSAFGFLVPFALVIGWVRLQARGDRRRAEFAEYWTLTLSDGRWTLSGTAPAPLSRKRGRGPRDPAPSPWSQSQAEGKGEPGLAGGARESSLLASANGHARRFGS